MSREHLVILDTNSLLRYPKLDGLLRAFLEQARDTAIKVCIPEIVVDELVCHRERTLRECLRNTRSTLAKLGKLVDKADQCFILENKLPSVCKQTASYDTRLRDTLFREGSATILSYPCLELSRMVRDAARRIPPFDEKGQNFRDYIIWCTVRSMVDRGVIIHFVTGDKKAFGEKVLHGSLSKQICEGSEVILHPDLASVMKEVVTPEMDKWEEIRRTIENGRASEFASAIEGRLDELVHFEIDSPQLLNIPPDASGITIDSYGNPEDISVEGAWRTKSDTALIEVAFEVECEIEFFVEKIDAVHSDQWEGMSVYELDWNNSVSQVGANRVLTVSAYLEINLGSWEADSLEIVRASGKEQVS